jgi:lipopolysaccharide transport system permease protein
MEDIIENTSRLVPPPAVVLRPASGWLDLDLAGVWRYRELLYYLVWRELKVRYRQAIVGAGWAIVQPVFAVLIFSVVFGAFARMPSDGVPYPLFAFAGMLPWAYFSEAMRRASTGLVGEGELIRKVYFPRLIIPLAMVLSPLVDFVLAFVVFAGLLAWYGVVPGWQIVFLPLFLLVAMLLAVAMGLWLGPVNVRFRDVMHTLPFLIQVWLYASPIVYPLSIVPERWRALYSLNPMVGVIEGFRWALLGRQTPDFVAIGISVAFIAVVAVAGLVFFRRMERSFADVI